MVIEGSLERERRSDVQIVISKFKNLPNKITYCQYRAYARASVHFELRGQDGELDEGAPLPDERIPDEALRRNCTPNLPDQRHGEKNSARNHRFNKSMMSLDRHRFRELLKAKCEVRDKPLVVCFEMHTSRTCGRCSRLHLKLGSNGIFSCPRCEYKVSRDGNAAFNILRVVCAGNLQVHPLD